MNLRFPTIADLAELEKHCLSEWALEWGFVHYFESILSCDCRKLIEFLPLMKEGVGIPTGHVPCSLMFAFNNENELLGRVSIRHILTDSLRFDGGHIGYAVVPGQRRKGIATRILKEALLYCGKELNLSRVLLTCDNENLGSIKTIESNGGQLIDQFKNNEVFKRRYQIIISNDS
jgi:predicted acetyltransferase